MTVVHSVLHFLVDGVCAWAMLGRFWGDPGGFLVYNFCAFALQLPLGAVLDRLTWGKLPRWFAGVGCALTLLGAFLHPAVLGLGNALFHVGGGVEVISEDAAREKNGALLGVFVAPGALGLYAGGLLAGGSLWAPLAAGLGMALCFLIPMPEHFERTTVRPWGGNGRLAAGICFFVVVLRSFVGLSVGFPWKTGVFACFATVMVVGGKMLGGLLAARFGGRPVAAVSLVLAALGFWLGEMPVFGLLALLCFNMTMPLTLYALWRRFPAFPGAVFGGLTLALFLGFVPVYFGLAIPLGGAAASVLSLLLLWKVL